VKEKVAASAGGPLLMSDLLGEKVTVAPTDDLSVDVARPADVQVDLPRKKFRDLAAARAAVEAHGATVLEDATRAGEDKSISLVITFPAEKRDQGMSAISDLDPLVRYRPVRTTYTVRAGDLSAGKEGLLVKVGAETKELSLTQILAIRTVAAVQIPDDALILLEGDRPAEHYKTVVVAVFLLGFAVLNLLALRSRA